MRTFILSLRFLLLCLLFTALLPATSQTIIDLKKGNVKVRSKNLHDFDVENKHPDALREDSLLYADNLKRAFNYLYADSLEQAEVLLRDCLKLRPNARGNFVVRRTLGQIALGQERYKEAIEEFTSVLRTHPSDESVRFDRASAYLGFGNARAALQDCDVLLQAEQTDSFRARTLFLRAATKIQLRNYNEARQDLRRVIELDPQNENAPILLAMCLYRDGRPQEAYQRLEVFISLHPKDVQALAMRAMLFKADEKWEQAQTDYDELILLEPNNTDFRVGRAEVLIQLGEKSAARRDLDKAVSLGLPRASLQSLYQQCR
ncbi:MAG: tetratricopeptide repeat protein [Alloprevotella sp.]|nr:tetratricopeptide repeat protein [Alloprevotella sp.]